VKAIAKLMMRLRTVAPYPSSRQSQTIKLELEVVGAHANTPRRGLQR
jgi:hypothetical protein